MAGKQEQATLLAQRDYYHYFTNIRKEITKSPVYYFADMGLRNFACGHFGKMLDVDAGFVFQTMVHGLLWERFPTADTSIHYWRTKDKAEVDFVVRRGDRIVPLEVKYRMLRKPEIRRSFRSFIERYAPKTGLIINLGLFTDLTIGTTQVRCLPYWELLFEDWLEIKLVPKAHSDKRTIGLGKKQATG